METPESLIECAKEAFEAIKKSTGREYGIGMSTLRDAYDAFLLADRDIGVVGIIDACGSIGMTHLGISYWFSSARKLLGN